MKLNYYFMSLLVFLAVGNIYGQCPRAEMYKRKSQKASNDGEKTLRNSGVLVGAGYNSNQMGAPDAYIILSAYEAYVCQCKNQNNGEKAKELKKFINKEYVQRYASKVSKYGKMSYVTSCKNGGGGSKKYSSSNTSVGDVNMSRSSAGESLNSLRSKQQAGSVLNSYMQGNKEEGLASSAMMMIDGIANTNQDQVLGGVALGTLGLFMSDNSSKEDEARRAAMLARQQRETTERLYNSYKESYINAKNKYEDYKKIPSEDNFINAKESLLFLIYKEQEFKEQSLQSYAATFPPVDKTSFGKRGLNEIMLEYFKGLKGFPVKSLDFLMNNITIFHLLEGNVRKYYNQYFKNKTMYLSKTEQKEILNILTANNQYKGANDLFKIAINNGFSINYLVGGHPLLNYFNSDTQTYVANHYKKNRIITLENTNSENVLKAQDAINFLYGFCNNSGDKWLIKPKFISVSPFNKGSALVSMYKGDRHIVLKEGETFVDKYSDEILILSNFYEGYAVATKKKGNGMRGYVNKQMEWVITPKYLSAGIFKDGRAVVTTKYGRVRTIDKNVDKLKKKKEKKEMWKKINSIFKKKQ